MSDAWLAPHLVACLRFMTKNQVSTSSEDWTSGLELSEIEARRGWWAYGFIAYWEVLLDN